MGGLVIKRRPAFQCGLRIKISRVCQRGCDSGGHYSTQTPSPGLLEEGVNKSIGSEGKRGCQHLGAASSASATSLINTGEGVSASFPRVRPLRHQTGYGSDAAGRLFQLVADDLPDSFFKIEWSRCWFPQRADIFEGGVDAIVVGLGVEVQPRPVVILNKSVNLIYLSISLAVDRICPLLITTVNS